jgi:hypothetical protein
MTLAPIGASLIVRFTLYAKASGEPFRADRLD